jgi:hypothetical protein
MRNIHQKKGACRLTGAGSVRKRQALHRTSDSWTGSKPVVAGMRKPVWGQRLVIAPPVRVRKDRRRFEPISSTVLWADMFVGFP